MLEVIKDTSIFVSRDSVEKLVTEIRESNHLKRVALVMQYGSTNFYRINKEIN